MNAIRICSVCSKPLAANAPQGLCPECLLKAGLGTGVDIGPDSQSQAESGKVPFVAPTPNELAKPFPQLEILGFIGQGGMGAVYKARQKALDRIVALKILPPGIGKDPAFAERFTREAKALAKLNHPGIVTLYEFGQADGLFYFLMEFVDGVNLRQLLEAGRLSPREALAIVPQICDALQYAHDQGIVHRDIKPENILLDRQGRVKVADFGLAKLVGTEGEPSAAAGVAAGSVTLTEVGKVMGTPQYMAPEQREHPAEVDHRVDIYSLGVVLYQMLTGELPGKRIEAPSHKVQIDVRLDEVVLRALEMEPERRYQQASQLKTAVETIAQSCPPADASPPPADRRTWSPFQSPQVREICDHMTEAERREWTLRGALFGIWNAATFFVPWGIAIFVPKPLNWVFAATVLLVGLAFYPLWQRIMREFLASTIWARQQGIAPESLRMSPHIILVGRRSGQAVIHWPGVLLSFVRILALAEAGAIFASTLLLGWIDSRFVGVAFTSAVVFIAILVRRGLRMPVEQLTTLGRPNGTEPKPAAEERKRTVIKVVLCFLAAAVGIGTLGAWVFLPGGRRLTGPANLVVVVMFFMTILTAAMAALGSRWARAKPIERAPRLDGPPDRAGITLKVAAIVLAVMVLTITVSLVVWLIQLRSEKKASVPMMPPKTAVAATVPAVAARPNGISEVRCDGRKAYIQAELDDLHELRLFIGSDALGWSARQTGSASVTATLEASDQIKLDDGSMGHGLIFQAWSVRHYIAITPDGPVPFGEVVFRENANVTEKDGTFTFADIRQADGTLIPVSIRVRPGPAAAGVSSNSAAQSARLKLEQAQAALVRAKTSYDAGTASLTEYQTARLAKDIAEAELSGDTAAILRAKLQFAQEQLLQAESRFKAGLATQTEVEKAKLAKGFAEAQLSGDATAIARTELQFAQLEFLEVEARYKAGLATQAEFEKAKAARDAAQAERGMLLEPPTLRFLAWQDENPSWRDWKAWRPNGERADTKDEQGLLLQHLPARIDLSATKEGRGVRVLFVWFSHPDIQRRSYTEMTMADPTGRTISPCLDGYGGGIYPSRASEGELGWVVRWFAPARDATLPSTVNLTLRYSLGDWQFPLMVTREVFGGTMQTEWGDIPGAGETLDGKAFVSLVRNTAKGRDLHVDFAAETMDGRLIEPSGTLASGPPKMRHERFEFDPPLGQIKEFRLRTCPIRTAEYRNVSLQAGHSAEVQVSPVSSSQPVAFSPVIERVIATTDGDDQGLVFFDMETGASFKPLFPLEFHPNQAPAFVELTPEIEQWIRARDVDVLLHLGEENWDMMTLEMQEGFAGQLNEWETISPEKVIALFAQKDAEHLVRDEVPASSFGNSYRDGFGSFNAFRTRSNTVGVYQFEGADNGTRRGVGIRYKLVQGADGTSATPSQTNASKTFSLRYMLASEMADDLRQILLGRFGLEARPAPDNMQLTVTAPPDVLNRVSTFITVADWPNRIARGSDFYYPHENVELAARSFFYACSIEDADGVALMLSPGLLAELSGTSLTAHGVLGEEKDVELVRQLRGNWPGKEAAVREVIQAWNRFPLQRLWAEPGVAIGFGLRYFATGAFEGAPEERTRLSFIPDRTGGTNGPLTIDTLPPWLPASPGRESTGTKQTLDTAGE